MGSKKIWIISEIYYPIKTSTGYYLTEIAEYLARRDMVVHVLCTGAVYSTGESRSVLKKECRNGVKIYRVPIFNISKNSFFKRTLRLLLSSLLLFFKVIRLVKRGDSVLVVTNPAFILLLMPCIAWIKKIRYTILVHDIFPENLSAINKISSSSIIYQILKKIFDKSYSRANICISIGRDMNEILAKKIHDTSKICLIPIWAENDNVFSLDKRKTIIASTLGLNNKFVFQFAGNLGHAQGIENLLKAINLVANNDIHFLFIGDGAKRGDILSFINNHNQRNITLMDFQDRSKQNDFLNACDIGIVTLTDGMYGLGVPSKSYNIMAAGKPILFIGDEKSEIALCIKEYSLGWVVEPNNPQALAEKIEYIYKTRDRLSQIKANERYVADTVFAKEIILEKYYSLLSGN